MRYHPDPHDPEEVGRPDPAGFAATIAMDAAGLVLGADTRLVRRANDGRLALAADRARLLALLSVAAGRAVADDVLPPIQAAADDWQGGDKALANFRLLFADLPRLDGPTAADHLRMAEHLLDRGMPPQVLTKAVTHARMADDLAKYDPNQPRVPAGQGRESGRWAAFWTAVQAWLAEEVPEYDTDTGEQVGTRTRARALATNPITVGIAGAAAFLGGEAAAGAVASATAIPTIAAADATLPQGMTRAMFGKLAGFEGSLDASAQASTAATAEVVTRLQAAGVTRKTILTWQRFYVGIAKELPQNLSAIHRSELLKNIGKIYPWITR